MSLELVEVDENGRVNATSLDSSGTVKRSFSQHNQFQSTWSPSALYTNTVNFLSKVFLPTGYPDTVTSDYLTYQVYNALQSFCSSFATLLANRAVLEAKGVGDASATATNALLLTVVQDGFARLATIIGAYYLGTALYPEAKVYRFLADVLNDFGIVLDAITPLFISSSYSSYLTATALSLSGCVRAVCGVVAGGSKASITNHFASPPSTGSGSAMGDVGDLNAKDGSKETVLALFGMLAGTLLIPYLTQPERTYPVLLVLLVLHLVLNYRGVQALELRTLNRQRVGILWKDYAQRTGEGCLTPLDVSKQESIFNFQPSCIRTQWASFTCIMGGSLLDVELDARCYQDLTEIFRNEKYILCQDPKRRRIIVCFKEGWEAMDTFKAWLNALELADRLSRANDSSRWKEESLPHIQESLATVDRAIQGFTQSLSKSGWVANSQGVQLMIGVPKTVLRSVTDEPKKSQ